jgi:hypothetical protein
MTDEMMTYLLREMIGFTAQRPMEVEVEGLSGGAHGERSPERINHSGYRERPLGDARRHSGAAYPQAAQRPGRKDVFGAGLSLCILPS